MTGIERTSLEEKKKIRELQGKGFFIPNMTLPLRNSKNIVDFALEKLSDPEEFLGIDNIVLISTELDSPPDNAIPGYEVLSFEKGTLQSDMNQAFSFLPPKTLVIVDSDQWRVKIARAVENVTNQTP